ncbi:MAG: glutamyl-tRNA reductase [Propionibacteriaceae bacterium]
MSILVVSVSHKTTSIEDLAQVAMDLDTSVKLAGALVAGEHVDEAVVLSTCNRTEIYTSVVRFHAGLDEVTAEVARVTGRDVDRLRSTCGVYFDEAAVAHTFGVASGLDSMVLGENQILGQVRAALTGCQLQGTVGTVLNALFQQAIRVGKRVQTETEVGGAGRSLLGAGLQALGHLTGPIAGRRVAVVGAGSMAALAARTVVAQNGEVLLVNRTLARAEYLAAAVGGRALPLDRLAEALADVDLVITCTGARGTVIGADSLTGTSVRGVLDLALPADVAPEVGLTVPLVNLASLLAADQDHGGPEVEAARELVRGEVNDFLGVRRAAQVAPTVVALRTMATDVMTAELTRLDARLPGLTEGQRSEVHRAVRRVVEKLLHAPTVRVQEYAADPDATDYAAALRELFALDPQAVAAVMSAKAS